MKIAISATNPCHLYPLARELWREEALACYLSGYPRWKLRPPAGFPVRTHSLRTNAVYALLRIPERFRPAARDLFLWQDHGFDRWASQHLPACDAIHAMPGQALETFRAARQQGIRTVLNHATGPVRAWVRIMEPEYRRVGLRLTDHCPYDEAYFRREAAEYELADLHCAASTVVRDQLLAEGIAADRIWVVPYGAEEEIFHPAPAPLPAPGFRIVFAGQAGLRKGLRTLLDALMLAGEPGWELHFHGAVLGEASSDLAGYKGNAPLHFHGPVPQPQLAEAFRAGSVLVLPSLEEGFGLVVPQALSCGLPAIVSDRVGARDLVRHRENGSVFPVQDAEALASELRWWAAHPARVHEHFPWAAAARKMITLSSAPRS